MTSEVTFREATPELAARYYDTAPAFTFQGYVAMLNGLVVGIGGISLVDGLPWIFSEMKPVLRPRRKDKARAVRVLEKLAEKHRGSLYAVVTEDTAPRLLERMGFCDAGWVMPQGPVMVRPHAA